MYPWVSNEIKYFRAVKALKDAGKEVTEEAVKELYVKYSGKVLDVDEIAAKEEDEVPKKRGRSAK